MACSTTPERKNGWTLAEEAGHEGPDRIHRLLNRIEWDADEVLGDVRDYVVEHLGDRDAVLIVDDTGFLKKGLRSAGVQRQYSGTAGTHRELPDRCVSRRDRYPSIHSKSLMGKELKEVGKSKTDTPVFMIDEIDPATTDSVDYREAPPVTRPNGGNGNKSPIGDACLIDSEQVILVLIDRDGGQQIQK